MTTAQTPTTDPEQEQPCWRVSIISHGHGCSVGRVLLGLFKENPGTTIRFVVTINIADDLSWVKDLPEELQQQLRIKRNERPKSFAQNHNQALAEGNEPFLIAADPELVAPFPKLEAIEYALKNERTGLVAPQALDEHGKLEDNGRSLPRPLDMLWRNLARRRSERIGGIYARSKDQEAAWIAGFFISCRRCTWQKLGGFDTRYRMYCEDVDLGLRCWLAGHTVQVLGNLRVGHPARRATFSHLQHLQWHMHGLLRLWFSACYRQYRELQKNLQAP